LDQNGDSLWMKTYGGTGSDHATSLKQTPNGGFIISGESNSYSGSAYTDAYLISTDANGDTNWTKTYNIQWDEWANSVDLVGDSGYVMVGGKQLTSGSYDILMIRTDTNGSVIYTKTYGGGDIDHGISVKHTSDNGFIFMSKTKSYGAGDYDYYLIKTDINGDTLWTETYGGSSPEYLYYNCMQQTSDNGFVIVGGTQSFGLATTAVYLVKTDSLGNITCPTANFEYSEDSLYTVSFTDSSTFTTSWSWNFGDGNTDTVANPIHTYSDTGTYNVCLTASSACGFETKCKTVNVSKCIETSFVFNDYSDSLLYVVMFDQSYFPEKWLWDFGDGTVDSTTLTPDHTYSGEGPYEVCLTSENACGQATFCRTIDVQYSDCSENFEAFFIGPNNSYGFAIETTPDCGTYFVGKQDQGGSAGYDVYLIKTDAAGKTEWSKFFDNSISDAGEDIHLTNDNGLIISGSTYNSVNAFSKSDYYLMKTNLYGDTLWTRSYGTNNDDWGQEVLQTSDSGYVFTGYLENFLADKDVFLVRTNAVGDTIWTRDFGGSGDDFSLSLALTNDNGYVLAGYSNSFSSAYDCYLIKVDSNGDTVWTKVYGGTKDDALFSIKSTTDGGFITAGYSDSYSAGGDVDVYVLKIDSVGDTSWTQTYGGTGQDYGRSIALTDDGGYVISGYSTSYGAGDADVLLLKIDNIGNTQWIKTFGRSSTDDGSDVEQTSNGGYVIGGYSFNVNDAEYDLYLLKVSPDGKNCDVSASFYADGLSGCQYDSLTLYNTSVGFDSILWTLNGISYSSDTNLVFEVDTFLNQYQFSLIVSDTGCTDTAEIVIGSQAIPMVNLSFPDSICNGNSFTIDAGSGYIEYLWSDNSTSQILTTSLGGTYFVEIMDTNECINTDTALVLELPNPIATITPSGNTEICPGGSVDLSANTSSAYNWSTSETSQLIKVGNAGTFTVTIFDINNCLGSDSIVITTSNSCDSVWPGDCNYNGKVHWNDLFLLGRYYGKTGLARDSIGTVWKPYSAENWTSITKKGLDLKHLDCNGDGKLNRKDQKAIKLNYKRSHAKTSSAHQNMPGNPDLYFDILTNDIAPGATVEIAIMLGRDTNISLYGIGFEVKIDVNFVQNDSIEIDFSNGIFANDTNFMSLRFFRDTIQTLYGALVRTDTVDIKAFGELGRLKFTIDSTVVVGSDFNIFINNSGGVINSGDSTKYNHPVDADTTIKIQPGVGIDAIRNTQNSLHIYPNPFTGNTQIYYKLNSTSDVQLEVYNLLGKKVDELVNEKQPKGSYQFNFSGSGVNSAKGIYLLKLQVDGQVTIKKLIEY